MTSQQAQTLHLNLTYIYSVPPGAGYMPLALPLALLGASFVFLVVGAQLGPLADGLAAFFFSWVLTFYFIDILMEAVAIHNCQVLEWVPLGVAAFFALSVLTFLRSSVCGQFALGGVLGLSIGFEAYCVLLFTIQLGPSVIESKETAGFDNMYWLTLLVPSLVCAITAATVVSADRNRKADNI